MKGMTPKKIWEDMTNSLGNDFPSGSTVKNWTPVLKRGKAINEDEPTLSRPN